MKAVFEKMLLETSDGNLQFKGIVKWVILKTKKKSIVYFVQENRTRIDSGSEMLSFIAFALGRIINIVL